MQLDDLKRYGIPGPLLAAWRERQGDLLLPLQSAAVLGGLLSDRRDTLIAGPTSSGKSFCGELALARSLIERRKGAFVVPLKSIAEEKFAALEPICKKLKLRAIIATADHPGSDSLLESGRFDIAVCVYEKFNRLLLANIDMLATFNVVVIDELQLVSDPERGRVLESLLIKMRGFAVRAGSAPRLVALSAASGGLASSGSDDELAAWLNLRLVRETTRPRDLRQGVIYNEEYIYRSFNTGLIGREPFQLGGSESASGADDSASGVDDKTSGNRLTDRLLGVLRRAPGQKLVFLSSRRATMRAAFELAAVSAWPRAAHALSRLAGEEPSSVTRSLAQTLTRGVAFHSADLTALQRLVIEESYRAGEIQVIFSTTTLALGVNLPAETVFVEPQKYCVGPINGPGGGPDRPGRRPRRSRGSVTGMLPLPASEFASIAGRAGRYRADALTAPGASDTLVARAALLAETEFERDILWETYIEPHEVDPLVSAFAVGVSGGGQWASLALELVVSGLAGSLAELETLLANSLVWRAEPESVRAALGIAVARLIECGLVVTEQAQDRTAQERPGERLCASAAGRAGALSGLSIAGIERFISAANGPQPVSERQWLASALSAPDLERAAGSRLPRGSHFAALRRLFADAPGAPEAPEESGSLQEFIQPSRFGHGRAISASALNCRLAALAALELWRSGQEGRALESETQLSVAQIAELARVAGWLLGALADIRTALARGFDADEQIQTQIQTLRRTLRAGLPAPVAALGERTGRLFNRSELMALNSLGCASAAEIAALPEKVVVEALESASLGGTQTAKQKLAALSALLSNKSGQGASPPPAHREEKHMPHTATLQTTQTVSLRPLPPQPIQPAVGLIPCRLRIDGASCGERFLVTIDGLPAPLTGKSFKYLAKLACARSTTPEGWLYKDEIEQGFNQARYLYRMRREIEAALPGYNWPVYENNRLGYYRLRLDPQALEIDIERIAASHDYEVAALAETLRLQRPPDLHCQTAP